jgi:hypothetical protein
MWIDGQRHFNRHSVGIQTYIKVQIMNLLSKYCVLKIQVRLGRIGYEKLTAISVWSIVCH